MADSLMDKATAFADANKVVPLTNDFDETKSTAGRVDAITAANSPLMQRAAVQGTQLAATRGLTNSSLAAEASQNAVLTAATPIATADAQLYSQNSLANLAAKNQAANTNATNATQLGGTAMSLENSNQQQDKTLAQQAQQFDTQAQQAQQQIDNQVSQFAESLGMTKEQLQLNRDQLTAQQQQALAQIESQQKIAQLQSDTSLQTANISAETQKAVAQTSQATQLQVAQLENQYKADIQGDLNISNAWGSTMTNISTIQNNPNLEQAAKQTLIQNSIDSFQSYAAFWKKTQAPAGSSDISDLLNFNTANATTPSGSATGGSISITGQPGQSIWTPSPGNDDTVGRGG